MRQMKLWNRIVKTCKMAVTLSVSAGILSLSGLAGGLGLYENLHIVEADELTSAPTGSASEGITQTPTQTPTAAPTAAPAVTATPVPTVIYIEDEPDDPVEIYGSSTTTSSAKAMLDNYNSNLQQIYEFTVENRNKLNKICNDAKTYIDNHTDMIPTELDAYVADIRGQMETFASKYGIQEIPLSSTSEYIGLYNNLEVLTVDYGQTCMVVLPVVNYCEEDLNNIIVKPQMSADVSVWPFEIEQTGYSQVIPYLPGNETRDTVYENRMEIGWMLNVRKDVVSGYYELKFDVTYERNGATESAVLTTYVNVNGSPEADKKDEEENARVSTPRIIVTGFETNPTQVFAGDTFTLTLHVQNTSSKTSVSNILFDLQAAASGGDNLNAVSGVAPFLPTSGSSTIFEDYIAPNASVDISIEMTARADLSQKPYVLNVTMDYEDEKANPYSQEANVSIPIYQEAKYEIGSMDIVPSSIATYEESNVMFSIYNTGKTTLYNVQIKFDQEFVSGGDVFLGKLDPGATGSVDTMVMGLMPNEGYVTAYISYEDESGNVTTIEKEIELYIYEMVYDEYMEDVWMEEDPMMMEEGEKSDNKTFYIVIGCVAAGIVVASVVTTVIIKKRKKKKMLLELEKETEDEIL